MLNHNCSPIFMGWLSPEPPPLLLPQSPILRVSSSPVPGLVGSRRQELEQMSIQSLKYHACRCAAPPAILFVTQLPLLLWMCCPHLQGDLVKRWFHSQDCSKGGSRGSAVGLSPEVEFTGIVRHSCTGSPSGGKSKFLLWLQKYGIWPFQAKACLKQQDLYLGFPENYDSNTKPQNGFPACIQSFSAQADSTLKAGKRSRSLNLLNLFLNTEYCCHSKHRVFPVCWTHTPSIKQAVISQTESPEISPDCLENMTQT